MYHAAIIELRKVPWNKGKLNRAKTTIEAERNLGNPHPFTARPSIARPRPVQLGDRQQVTWLRPGPLTRL